MADVTRVRSPDWLLTPDNAVLAMIDYQPDQYAGVGSIAHDAAMQRMIQAGAHPISVLGQAGDLQRGWFGGHRQLRGG